MPDNRRMFDALLAWSAPYGGASFLYLSLLALLSYAALLRFKARLTPYQLRRGIRLAALIALPISFLSMEMGEHNLGIAVLALVWCVVVGITCKNEINRRTA